MSTTQADSAAAGAPARTGWIFGPATDLLLMLNVLWPALIAVLYFSPWTAGPLTFLQVYFISTPHRFITLILVLFGERHFPAQPRRFTVVGLLLLGVVIAGLAAGALFPYGDTVLVYLLMIDFVWGAWHFAAQAGGISRIYAMTAGVKSTDEEGEFEKSALRIVLLWSFLRVGLTSDVRSEVVGREALASAASYASYLDPLFFIPVGILLYRELSRFSPAMVGRVGYIVSVTALYATQIAGIRMGDPALVKAAFVAGAVFHATEYMAICGWSMGRQRADGVWAYIVPRVPLVVLGFMLVLGLTQNLVEVGSVFAWTVITVYASFLHYGFDGMIWKRPKKAKAG
ncbi:MAG: hypothetical protein EP330_24290 [Deltaproteobacteria bacterium]|nr:MAG: hypothetical protein EP330_24290 [Deltaproteobacteria bacterium]